MKVAVVGSGYMGRGIAQTLVLGSATVVLVDQTSDIAEFSLMKLVEEVAFAEKNGLVTREEFDVQTEVLKRTRQKLEELEKKLSEIEARKK